MMKRGHDVESAPSIWRRRTAMEHYAGIDVSLELSSVCVVDTQGKIVKEAKVASEPEALVAFFEALSFAVRRIGLEAGPGGAHARQPGPSGGEQGADRRYCVAAVSRQRLRRHRHRRDHE